MMRKQLAVLILLTLAVNAPPLSAARPGNVPPGMGVYVMVLWPPGTPKPGDAPGHVENLPTPDVVRMGGKLLHQNRNEHFIMLPVAAAKELRRNPAVVFLQRLWMGEPLNGWDETPPTDAHSRFAPQTDAGALQWGPKAYQYDGSGNIKSIGPDAYMYDTAGRLIQATVSGKTETYKYDAFGNLIEKKVTGGNAVSIPIDPSSNRVLGTTYDVAGNVTSADTGTRTYFFDAFNSLTLIHTAGGVDRRLVYDAADERLGMLIVGDSVSRWTFRDFDGRAVREYKSDDLSYWTWEQDYVYAGGALVGGETPVWPSNATFRYGGTRHYHLDHLGSVRMVTDSQGKSISEHDYFPFGANITRTYQEQINWGDPHIDAMRFAGHARDFLGLLDVENTEYLDYMHARYHDPNWGRFLSVDPVISKAAMRSPQLWNRYAYVGNNPLNRVDPDGRLLQLSACKSGPSDSCTAAYNLYLSTFGKQTQEAAKHLQVGKNGVVSITGMSGGAFAKQFGVMGRATNYLVSNRAAVFSLTVGRSAMTDAHKGGYCDCYSGADKTIGVDPGKTQMLGGVLVNPTETLAHELGHAVASLIPGIAFDVGQAKAKSYGMKMFDGNYEGYATAFENVWRHSVLGDPNARTGYIVGGDEYDTTSPSEIFP